MTARLRGLPLRTQLLVLTLGLTALVVVVTSLAGTLVLHGYLLGRVDRQLSDTLTRGVRIGPPPAGATGGYRRFAPPTSYVTALYDAAGVLVVREGLREGDPGPRLPALVPTQVAALQDAPFTVDAESGAAHWRVRVAALSGGGTLVVAIPLSEVEDTTGRLLRIDALVGVVALALAGGLSYAGVRRSLHPLVTVEHTAEAIAAGNLSVRVPETDRRTEVGHLAVSFNAMVDRFESAYRAQQVSEADARASESRMRQFVADASHELRTPLTSIRGFAELFRQGAVADPEALARVIGRIEAEAARMGLLVEDLLLLARLDQQRPLRQEPVDLAVVAADAVHDASVLSEDHVVELQEPAEASYVVTGDDGRLRQVLGNLVTNAVVHTPAGTTVRVSVHRQLDRVVVEVRDDGPGMTPEVAARVFERFYRADSSRTRERARTGSGLGLSIVRALVAAHGGEVHLDTAPGRGTAFRVALPLDMIVSGR